MSRRPSNAAFWLLGRVVLAAGASCLLSDDCTLLTADQRAYRLFEHGD